MVKFIHIYQYKRRKTGEEEEEEVEEGKKIIGTLEQFSISIQYAYLYVIPYTSDFFFRLQFRFL